MSLGPPSDPGLQPERTALAWRRTAFALAIGALITFRVLVGIVGLVAAIPAAAGLVVATAIFVSSHHRYRRHHRALTAASAADRVPGGGLIPLTAAIALLFGLGGAVFVICR